MQQVGSSSRRVGHSAYVGNASRQEKLEQEIIHSHDVDVQEAAAKILGVIIQAEQPVSLEACGALAQVVQNRNISPMSWKESAKTLMKVVEVGHPVPPEAWQALVEVVGGDERDYDFQEEAVRALTDMMETSYRAHCSVGAAVQAFEDMKRNCCIHEQIRLEIAENLERLTSLALKVDSITRAAVKALEGMKGKDYIYKRIQLEITENLESLALSALKVDSVSQETLGVLVERMWDFGFSGHTIFCAVKHIAKTEQPMSGQALQIFMDGVSDANSAPFTQGSSAKAIAEILKEGDEVPPDVQEGLLRMLEERVTCESAIAVVSKMVQKKIPVLFGTSRVLLEVLQNDNIKETERAKSFYVLMQLAHAGEPEALDALVEVLKLHLSYEYNEKVFHLFEKMAKEKKVIPPNVWKILLEQGARASPDEVKMVRALAESEQDGAKDAEAVLVELIGRSRRFEWGFGRLTVSSDWALSHAARFFHNKAEEGLGVSEAAQVALVVAMEFPRWTDEDEGDYYGSDDYYTITVEAGNILSTMVSKGQKVCPDALAALQEMVGDCDLNNQGSRLRAAQIFIEMAKQGEGVPSSVVEALGGIASGVAESNGEDQEAARKALVELSEAGIAEACGVLIDVSHKGNLQRTLLKGG